MKKTNFLRWLPFLAWMLVLSAFVVGPAMAADTVEPEAEMSEVAAEEGATVEASTETAQEEVAFPWTPSFLVDDSLSWVCIQGSNCSADWHCGNTGYCTGNRCFCL